ncbi:histidine phosphatase family protein [Paenibacillus radicis (ex Xue et al. 2023)]|uniref:Histidine phosphatase family protein n=1 Tax=Paenibacillus radicis (ex Xue et al. 2023) TaxID=2972489 RepID=A0ABT1YQP6_9BACL|nr:histidine phosphatase family protein [Paenibacillus radicis (ex Xue et al. 2023)]MCR8635507.1 histidine phosphatase family protein [Paenibacillus radicis (ex Xue et al. 2023)]
MGTTIYMVRHAESPFSIENERVRELSPKGRADAEAVTNIMLQQNIQAIVSSPYRRAIQTVEGLAKQLGLEIEIEEDLRERLLADSYYPMEDQDFMPTIERVFKEPSFAMPGGESNEASQKRSISALQQVMKRHKGKNIAVGTHGNIMTVMMNYFDSSYGLEFWKQTSKPDIYKLQFDNRDQLIEVRRLWELA